MSIAWGPLPNVAITSGVQAGEVLAAARTHLNDDEGILWPDQKLFPKLREAHRALQLMLVQNGVPVIVETSVVITVPANTKEISTVLNYPTNVLMPLYLMERAVGQQDSEFVAMRETEFPPTQVPTPTLGCWWWTKQKLMTLGSTSAREVFLRYRGGIKIPQEVTDPIGPYFGELYLSYKTAALAVGSVTPRDTERITFLSNQAEMNLENLLANAALQAQSMPAKRRPYHRR